MKSIILTPAEVRQLQVGEVEKRVKINPQPPDDDFEGPCMYHPTCVDKHGEEYPGPEVYGISATDGYWGIPLRYLPGDSVYVREGWTPFCINKKTCRNALLSHSDYCFKASLESAVYGCCDSLGCKWHSPVTMPREAARLFGTVTDTRVEQVGGVWWEVVKIRREEKG